MGTGGETERIRGTLGRTCGKDGKCRVHEETERIQNWNN